MHPVMKTFIKPVFVVVILIHSMDTSFSQECYWSSQVGGIQSEHPNSIVSDRDGNIYIGGIYYSNPFITNTGEYYCYGINDMFVIKYDQSGTEIWSMTFGGENEIVKETFGSMVLDTINSRLLITGSFVDILILPDTTLTGEGLTIYLLAFDLDKNLLWARTAGGSGTDYSFGVTYDDMGYIYIAGSNNPDATFGHITIPRGGFIAKYDINGNLLWAKHKFRYTSKTFTYTEATPWNICYGNQYLYVNGNVVSDTIVVDSITATLPIGNNSVFLSSFSLEGDIRWLLISGAPYGGEGRNIVLDNNGYIYITGTIYGSSGIFGDDTIFCAHGDCFLAKYSSEGSYEWVQSVHPSGFANGLGVAIDKENNAYFTGTFMGEAHFGSFLLFSDATNIDDMNIFISRYSESGECIGVKQYSSGSSIVGIAYKGNVLHGGGFSNTLNIGPQPLTARGQWDVFISSCSPITGIIQPKPELSNTLLIYANPNTGQCRVTIPEEFNHEKTLILEIYDQTGRLIQKAQLSIIGDSIELDISAQAKGMYNTILSNGKKYYSGKIVFE